MFVSLYIAPSHYHHCVNLSEDTELIKCLSDMIFVDCVRFSIFFQLSIIKYMALCVFIFATSLVMIERLYTLSYHHNQIGSMNYYPLFRVRSWNHDMHCMYIYILRFADILYAWICVILQYGALSFWQWNQRLFLFWSFILVTQHHNWFALDRWQEVVVLILDGKQQANGHKTSTMSI